MASPVTTWSVTHGSVAKVRRTPTDWFYLELPDRQTAMWGTEQHALEELRQRTPGVRWDKLGQRTYRAHIPGQAEQLNLL